MAIKIIGVNVRHDGEVYRPGDVIEKITDHEAKRLVDDGFASFIEKPKEPKRKSDLSNAK